MSTTEAVGRIVEELTVALVECVPVPVAGDVVAPGGAAPEASPVERAAEATIEQTGAGPPPEAC